MSVEKAEAFFQFVQTDATRRTHRDANPQRSTRTTWASSRTSGLGYLNLVAFGDDAFRRRVAAYPARDANRLLARRRAVHPGRTVHRLCINATTIGLLATLKTLRDLGNTLIVIEHDEDTMREADVIVDIGPGAPAPRAAASSRVGSMEEILKNEESLHRRVLCRVGNSLPSRKSVAAPRALARRT